MSPTDRTGALPVRRVVLRDRKEPPLTAGDYEVRVSQTVGGDPDLGAVPDDVRHIRVTGPRYRLAATEILSTFPPANSDGPFSTRLAQIALKRSTLPWERAPSPERPWLALVLLTDGEGRYLPEVPVEQAVSAGVRLTGANPDGASCAAIEVPLRVVRQVFPSQQDLPFTCHVREVPLDDTELAQGDDDGLIAVVIGTRLPRPDMRYRACLVSLEGQWNELADNPPTEDRITKTAVYELDAQILAEARKPRADGVPLTLSTPLRIHSLDDEALSAKLPKEGFDREVIEHDPRPAGTGHTAADAWSGAGPATAAATAGTSVSATPAAGAGPLIAAARMASAVTAVGSVILDVSFEVLDPGARLLRFPVLATWEFRCEGGQDFAALVQDLDVGLLGTAAPSPGPADRRPQVAETGHIVLAGTDRAGGAASSWYRGPFVPRAVDRRAAEAVHVADQLRRVAEDGRAEIGEAAAFELGRLLALSSPSTVAALRDWRRSGFTARRAGETGAVVVGTIATAWGLVLDGVLLPDASFATALGYRLVADIGEVAELLPDRPVVDPLPKLDLLDDPATTIATGLALPLRTVRASFGGAPRPETTPGILAPSAQVGFEALARQPELLAPLAAGLGARVRELTDLAGRFIPAGPAGPAGPGITGPAPHNRGRRGRRDAGEPPPRDPATEDTVEALFPGARPMDADTDGDRR